MSKNKTLEDKICSLGSVIDQKRGDEFSAQQKIEEKTKLEHEQFELIDSISDDYGFSYDKKGFLFEVNDKDIPVKYWSLCFLYRALPRIIKKDKESLEFLAKDEFCKKQKTQERLEDLKERLENLEEWKNNLEKEVNKLIENKDN